MGGITLIALVVTIVILLILAGVTINLLFSDTGLLSKAQQAKNTWENAEQSDINAIGQLTNELNEMLNGTGIGGVIPEEIADITTLTEIQTENTKGKDIYGNVVMVPKGFKVVTSEGTTVPEGIVIEDGTGTETTTGNQFVWIPVGTVYKNVEQTDSSTIQLGRYTFDTTTGEPTPVQLAYTDDNPTNYINTDGTVGVIDTCYSELSISRPGVASTEIGVGENATAKSLEDFVDSVKTNKGYYLARYEASYGSGYNSEGSTDAEKYANAKPLSKVSIANSENGMNYTGGTLWNSETQINASKVCQNMYKDDNTVGVESDLVNSYAWDTAIVFIQEMENIDYANACSDTTGNNSLMDTGRTGDKVCNIFDMLGNLAEWTTENSTRILNNDAGSCTSRGGTYYNSLLYLASRSSNRPNGAYYDVGFRPILYVN